MTSSHPVVLADDEGQKAWYFWSKGRKIFYSEIGWSPERSATNNAGVVPVPGFSYRIDQLTAQGHFKKVD